jgi:hypothetical protein
MDAFGIIAAIGVLIALVVTFLQMTGNWEKAVDALRSFWEFIKAIVGVLL